MDFCFGSWLSWVLPYSLSVSLSFYFSKCSSVVTGIQLILFFSYSGRISSPQAAITGAQMRYITQDIRPQVCYEFKMQKKLCCFTCLIVQMCSVFVCHSVSNATYISVIILLHID